MKAVKIVETKWGLKINIKTEGKHEAPVIKSLPWDLTKRAWDPEEFVWQVDATPVSLELLGSIKCEVAEEVSSFINKVKKEKDAAMEASRATKSNIKIPSPKGLEYMPFQKAGIAYAMNHKNTLIADEMGLGKTIQAIGVINSDPSIESVLVVCPASLKLNWKKEVEKWLVRKMDVNILSKGDKVSKGVFILNYDIIHKMVDDLPAVDLIILDESHYIKNNKAKRTKATIAVAKKAERRILLTGTPIKNRPIELWTQINLLCPETFKSWWYYAKRYCGAYKGQWGVELGGATNIEELYEKLRLTCMVRRLKKDVLKELPSKVRQVIELPANGCSSIIRKENQLMEARRSSLDALHVAVELAKASNDESYYEEAVRQLKEAYKVSFTEMAKIRKEVAVSKIPYVINHIEDSIEDGEKIIVFAHHREVCDSIYNQFKDKAVILTGSTKNEDRQKAVDRFQSDPEVKVFVGSLHAAGTGITLTASSRVLFAELDWTPAIMQQAEDRAHRIGQEDNVLIQYLVLEGSLDSKIANDIANKLAVIEKALDKGGKGIEERIEKAKNDAAEFIDGFASKGVSRRKIEKESTELTKSQIEEVHSKLRALASVCDYASELDGSGFNKIDAGIGHSLAASGQLSPKQAALGARIVRKYHRQVGKLSF